MKLFIFKLRGLSMSSQIVRISILICAFLFSFYLAKNWTSGSDFIYQIILNSSFQNIFGSTSPRDFLSSSSTVAPTPLTPPPQLSPPPHLSTYGIIDDYGNLRNDFDVGDFVTGLIGGIDCNNSSSMSDNSSENNENSGVDTKKRSVKKFRACEKSKREYIPCLDNMEETKNLKSTEKGERFERLCPKTGLDCLIPKPVGYKAPIPWPQSRDMVWFSNVPHTHLVQDKGGRNWITRDGDKFKFPGGGTQFINGADKHIDQINEMVPDIAFGSRTRIALDVGCGVASLGAFLLSRNVLTMSIAPNDGHEYQIQFALERGVPAMVAAFGTHRLLYPSQAFDLIHCSHCRLNWTHDDGIILLEVNRMLRAGGYFVWAAQPVYKHEETQQKTWKEMLDLTTRMCWKLVKKEGYIAIWRKPSDNSCYVNRKSHVKPPLCDADDDPDGVWYTDLKPCISRLPENGYGANVTTWPVRLHIPPKRLQNVDLDAYMAKNDIFKADSKYWNDTIDQYTRVFHWKSMNLRNIMDMRAGFGGFATALHNQQLNSWVMNVVPISGPNTLPVIYDRGLLGVAHDWCEAFDTYPRTYDFLHAYGLFSVEKERCDIKVILLEMDRILRPGGIALLCDAKPVIVEIKEITDAMRWTCFIHDTSQGPYGNRKLLSCSK